VRSTQHAQAASTAAQVALAASLAAVSLTNLSNQTEPACEATTLPSVVATASSSSSEPESAETKVLPTVHLSAAETAASPPPSVSQPTSGSLPQCETGSPRARKENNGLPATSVLPNPSRCPVASEQRGLLTVSPASRTTPTSRDLSPFITPASADGAAHSVQDQDQDLSLVSQNADAASSPPAELQVGHRVLIIGLSSTEGRKFNLCYGTVARGLDPSTGRVGVHLDLHGSRSLKPDNLFNLGAPMLESEQDAICQVTVHLGECKVGPFDVAAWLPLAYTLFSFEGIYGPLRFEMHGRVVYPSDKLGKLGITQGAVILRAQQSENLSHAT